MCATGAAAVAALVCGPPGTDSPGLVADPLPSRARPDAQSGVPAPAAPEEKTALLGSSDSPECLLSSSRLVCYAVLPVQPERRGQRRPALSSPFAGELSKSRAVAEPDALTGVEAAQRAAARAMLWAQLLFAGDWENTSVERSKRIPRPPLNRLVVLGLCALLPALAGGCPEFRNSSVDAVDTATRSVLLGDTTRVDAVDSATTGLLNAVLDLLFDQLRTDEFS